MYKIPKGTTVFRIPTGKKVGKPIETVVDWYFDESNGEFNEDGYSSNHWHWWVVWIDAKSGFDSFEVYDRDVVEV